MVWCDSSLWAQGPIRALFNDNFSSAHDTSGYWTKRELYVLETQHMQKATISFYQGVRYSEPYPMGPQQQSYGPLINIFKKDIWCVTVSTLKISFEVWRPFRFKRKIQNRKKLFFSPPGPKKHQITYFPPRLSPPLGIVLGADKSVADDAEVHEEEDGGDGEGEGEDELPRGGRHEGVQLDTVLRHALRPVLVR